MFYRRLHWKRCLLLAMTAVFWLGCAGHSRIAVPEGASIMINSIEVNCRQGEADRDVQLTMGYLNQPSTSLRSGLRWTP